MQRSHRLTGLFAYTLIEILLVISIIGVAVVAAIPTVSKFVYTQYAALTIRQIQQAINYARSEAILHHQTVTICPSFNRYNCSNNWGQGLLVLVPNGNSRFFPTYVNSQVQLSLVQNGFSNNSVQIQANGLSYTNGHFTYRALNSTYIPQFNLYFNRALRTYASMDGY